MKQLLLASLMLLATAAFAHGPSHDTFKAIRARTVLVTTDSSMGTGIVIRDGQVLTVAHLRGTERIVLNKPRKLLMTNPIYDLTLLDVPEVKGKTPIGLAPEVTDYVFVIGFTPNVQATTFAGGYVFHMGEGVYFVDMPVFPGNSGSGVYNEKGQLVGIEVGIAMFCEPYCRPMAVVKSINIIKVFLSQGD